MLRVGTAGIPKSCPKQDSAEAVGFVKEIGLDAMELEFVRGVNMSIEKAAQVKREAIKHSVWLSVHAPYYINLASMEKDKALASAGRIIQSARVGFEAGAKIVVFHPGYYSGRSRGEAHEIISNACLKIKDTLDAEEVDILLGPETTGRIKQYGSVEELADLAQEVEGISPVIDWCHLHARTHGGLTSPKTVFEAVDAISNSTNLKNFHMHFSGVEYGVGGEKKHLPLSSNEPDYGMVGKALLDCGVDATLICESPLLEADALRFKKMISGFNVQGNDF